MGFAMNNESFILIAVIILGFAAIAFYINRKLSASRQIDPTLVEWLKSMQGTIEKTNASLNDAMRGSSSDMTRVLQSNTRQLNERLDEASRVIGDLKKNVGELSEVGRGIKSLQEFLQSPKLRGNIGEQVLADMIGQSFPKNSFHLQYPFHSGMKVDAVLKTDAGLLCIDSKFPMENFTLMHKGETENERAHAKKDFISDIKKHITDISKKYILPEEGTMDFALMYIPSESVYYEVANLTDCMEFARDARVYPVSPNTLYAHLQVLLLSYQGKELESKSREAFRLLRAISKDYQKAEEQLSVLGKHITNAYNSMNTVGNAFEHMGQKLTQTNRLGSETSESEK
jgi:DNA recombination protein RmuC